MMWPLSCYGKGDERCLLGGDTSFEELRWVVGAVALARGDANAVHARAREFARGKEDDVNAILGFPRVRRVPHAGPHTTAFAR